LEKEYPEDFPLLINSTEERRRIKEKERNIITLNINAIGYHEHTTPYHNSLYNQTQKERLKLWSFHLKNFQEVTKLLEVDNYYAWPSVINTILTKYLIRRWHPTIRVLLDSQIASCKHNDIPDTLFILFGNHPFALPQLLSTQFAAILDQINQDQSSNLTSPINSIMQPELRDIIIDFIISQSEMTTEEDYIITSFIHNNSIHIKNTYTPSINVAREAASYHIKNKSKEELADHYLKNILRTSELSKRQKQRKEKRIKRLRAEYKIPPSSENIEALYEEIKSKANNQRRKGYQQSICRKFNYLVRQTYIHAETLYTIVSIYYDRASHKYMSMAIPVDNSIQSNDIERIKHIHHIEGMDGIIERTSNFNKNERDKLNRFPKSLQDWANEQRDSEELSKIVEKMDFSENNSIPTKNTLNSDPEDFLFLTPEGAVQRSHTVLKEIHHNYRSFKILEDRLQTIVPNSLKKEIMIMFHDDYGHLGRNKTTKLIKSLYYWPTMYQDIQGHIEICNYCKCRKSKLGQGAVPIQSYLQLYGPNEQ